jgi:hypothetical protein
MRVVNIIIPWNYFSSNKWEGGGIKNSVSKLLITSEIKVKYYWICGPKRRDICIDDVMQV